MSSAVVDASVAVKWFIPQPLTEIAEQALKWELAAPDLILPEIGNALWKYVRAGIIGREVALAALNEIEYAYFDVIALDEKSIRRALELAADLDHPIYDCVYMAVAEKLDRPVLTDDQKFLAAARRGGIDVIALTDF